MCKEQIAMVMPVIRHNSAINVLRYLNSQSKRLDYLLVVDNSEEDFELRLRDKLGIDWKSKYLFNIEIEKQNKNIGTNAAWNKMWDLNYKYVGVIGDDYNLSTDLIQNLYYGLMFDYKRIYKTGMVTARIVKEYSLIIMNQKGFKDGFVVPGKEHMGATLMKKEFLLEIPNIPKDFFIFFGDNWFGYWVDILKKHIIQIDSRIHHEYKTDLKEKLNYPKVLEDERKIWKLWLRGEIEL